MKKIIALALLVLVVLSTSACLYPEPSETSVSEDYIVLEATDTYLLVVQIGDDAETIETMQYTAPNLFYPSVQIKAGEIVTKNTTKKYSKPTQCNLQKFTAWSIAIKKRDIPLWYTPIDC